MTTLLTVEAPLEDVETPERMLARGEIRLFRWELDGQTVRAIGVEKFRGSSHDIRLHPYRIGPTGIDVNLDVTISRDTRQIIEPIVRRPTPPTTAAPAAPFVSSVTPLVDEMRDLVLLGADVAPARTEIEAALAASNEGRLDEAQAHLSRVSSLVMVLVDRLHQGPRHVAPDDPSAAGALQRVLARADSVRTGVPPTSLPPPSVLQVQLGALLSLLPSPPSPPEPAPVAVIPAAAPPAPTPAPSPSSTEALRPLPAAVPSPPSLSAASTPAPSAPEPRSGTVPSDRAPPPVKVVGAPRPSVTKPLPAPPKPRPPVSTQRVARPPPAPAPAPRTGPQKVEPPPLPTTTIPEWRSPPSTSHGAGAPAPRTPVPTPSHAVAVRPAPGPAKKRRKAGAALPSKKVPVLARPPAPHEASSEVTPPPAAVATPAAESPPAAPPSPGAPPSVASKPRRRGSRKRKAPPVVSVEVEPIPPGVFGTPDEGSTPPDPPDPSPRPEE